MGKYRIVFDIIAQNQIAKHVKSSNKANIKKIEQIPIQLTEIPFKGIGNLEALIHELTGYCSARINQKR